MAKAKDGNIAELKQDNRNANSHKERGKELLQKSMHELGAGRSVLVDANRNEFTAAKYSRLVQVTFPDKSVFYSRDIPNEYKNRPLIYAIVDEKYGNVKYIGFTSNIASRIKSHVRDSFYKGNENRHICNWVLKISKQGRVFRMNVLELIDAEKAKEKEIFYIDLYSKLFSLANLTSGGDGLGTWVFSSEARQRMSDSAKEKYRSTNIADSLCKYWAKLSDDDVRAIFEAKHKLHMSNSQIAERFNTTISTVSNILCGKRYKHVSIELVKTFGESCDVSIVRKSELLNEAKTLFQLGATDEIVAKSTGRCVEHVRLYYKEIFGKTYLQSVTDRITNDCTRLLKSGHSPKNVAFSLGLDYTTVLKRQKLLTKNNEI